MSEAPHLPRAARAFVSFVALLRANGFAIAPEQTTAFLEAIELLGPRGPDDIRQAGLATLAPPPDRRATYDMLFRIHFLGGDEVPGAEGEDEEVVRLQDEGRGDEEPPLADEANVSGEMAARAEALAERRFGPSGPSDALRRLAREAPTRLPRRRDHRRMRAAWALGGPATNPAQITRSDGDVMRLRRLQAASAAQMLLLIHDVSGSKARSETISGSRIRLVQATPNVRVFTFGTPDAPDARAALKRREQALAAAAICVSGLGRRHPHRRRCGLSRRAALPAATHVVLRSSSCRRIGTGDLSACATRSPALTACLAPELAGAARSLRLRAADRALIAIRRFVDDGRR